MKSSPFVLAVLLASPVSILFASPVANYQAEGNANDATGNGHNGSVAGDVTFTGGRLNQGFSFPGTSTTLGSNVVTIPDSTDFKPTNLTVSAWVKFADQTSSVLGGCPAGQQFIVAKQNTRTFAQGFALDYALLKMSDGRLWFGADFGQNDEVAAISTTRVVAGRWYHVVVTYDRSAFKIYVNGKLEGQTAETRSLDHAATPVYLGRTNASDFDGLFKGVMDEVQFFDSALTPSQIPALDPANAGTGLVSWWRGEGNGKDFQGTNEGGAFGAGKVGRAFSFDGTSRGTVTVPQSSSLEPANVSLDAWVKLKTMTGTKGNIISKLRGGGGASPSYGLEIEPNGTANFFVYTSPSESNVSDRQSSTALVPGTWYHLAGTWDGTTARIYVNGSEENGGTQATTGSGAIDYTGAVELAIGARAGGSPMKGIDGYADEIDVFNRVLTANEIQSIYAAGSAGKNGATFGSSLVGWWRGEDNATDAQGNHDGTLVTPEAFDASGKVGQAFITSPATSNYLSIPDSPSLRVKAFTIDAWVNFSSLSGLQHIVGKALGGADADSFVLWYAGGALHGYMESGPQVDYTWSPTTGQWYHVAYTYDGSTQKLYVDGAVVASGNTTVTPSYDTHPALIGADYSNGNIAYFFDGKIDEVDLFDRALSASEISAIYAAGATGKSTGPSLSIADASCVLDSSGSGNMVFTVNVARPNASAITVDYQTVDGSAVAPTDYSPVFNDTLTIPANASSATITVPVDSSQVTPGMTFFVTLSNPSNATLNRAYGTGTILTGNAVNDFFTDSNSATQLWQYGYTATDGTGFTNFAHLDMLVSGFSDGGTAPVWNAPSIGDIGFLSNPTGHLFHYNQGTYQPTDELGLFPNPDGKKCVLRWKAPASGSYQVSGLFEGIESAGGSTTSDVSIVKNGDANHPLLFNSGDSSGLYYLNGYQVQKPFLLTVTVAAGDTLDFRVGWGSNNQYSYDGTGLKVTIAPVVPVTISFSATGPASAGAPIQFDATIATGWNVRVQAATTASPVEGDWTDLNDGNGGAMTEISSGNYRLTSTSFPVGTQVRFRAIAAKSGQTDVIAVPLGPFNLHQAVLSIGAKLTSTSDFANGYTAYIDDYLIYKLTFTNSGDANAKSLRITATVPDFQYADIPLLVKTTAGSTTVTLASGDTSQLQVGGTFASGPGLGGSVVGNPNGTTVYIPLTATIASITDSTHFVISQAATATSGTKTVSVLVQYGAMRKQFKASDISLSPGGTYVPETSPGAGNAKLVWNVGDLQGIVPVVAPYGYSQYVTFSVHLTSKVAVDQSIGIGNDYKVESASTPKQPVAGRTGFQSGSPNVSCRINGSISFLLTSVSASPRTAPNTVTPGGYLTYTFALYNRGTTPATNPVAVVEVPNNVRYADSYTSGMKGVFVTSGTQTAKLAYRTGSPLPQLVIKFSSLAAKSTVLLQVTFQVKWANPTDVAKISTINYGATFLNPTAPSTIVTQFTNLFGAANAAPFTSGSPSTYTVDTVTNASVALPVVGFTVAGATGPAPLKSTFTNTTTGTVTSWKWDFGDGTTSTAKTPPVHTYVLAGTYTVSLTATNAGGSRTVTTINAVSADGQDFFAFISDPANKLARSLNQSGVVNVNFAGSLDSAPDLHVWKQLSNTLSKSEDGGDGIRIDLVKPGEKLTFMIVAQNIGDSPADEVEVLEAMPDHCTYVASSAVLLGNTTSKTKSKINVVPDPDGRHLRFVGLHLEPNDTVTFTYTVLVSSSLVVPAPTDPPLLLTVGDFSIGSGSTTSTPPGFATARWIKVVSAMLAQPRLDRLIGVAAVTHNVAATKTALDTLYAKTPSAVPLRNKTDLLSYIPGVQRFYIHYENIGGAASTNFKLTFPLPSGCLFYRASWVTLTPNANPAGLPTMPGTIAATPTGGSIVKPAVLASSGNIEFKLNTLAAAGKGDVMVEVLIPDTVIQQAGSHVGDDSQTITVSDSLSPPPAPPFGAPPPPLGSFPNSHAAALILSSVIVIDPKDLPADPPPRVPGAGFSRTVSSQFVQPGDELTYTLIALNDGDVANVADVNFTIPDHTTFMSAEAGQNTIIVGGTDPGDVISASLASNNGPFVNGTQNMQPHTAAVLSIKLRVTAAVGDTIVDPNTRMGCFYHDPIQIHPSTVFVVNATGLQGRTLESPTQVIGCNYATLKNSVVLIDLRGGNVVAQGAGNVVAAGAGNILTQDGAGILTQDGAGVVAAGAGNLIAVQNPSSLTFVPISGLLANNAFAITSGKSPLGNFVIQNGNAIIAAGAGNIISAGAGNVVAAGAGNVVSQGGGNVVSQGGGNVVSQGGGNVVAAGGGNIIASGGGNIVSAGGGNVVAAGGGNIVATGGGNVVSAGAGNVVAAGGGN